MDGLVGLFNTIFLIPLINLLVFFYKIFESIGLPGALGFAIIAVTVVIRMLIWPMTHTQLKSAQKMMSMRPLLDELKAKHKDKVELQRAQMALYKEHGVNPAAGCLPILLQFPILVALYNAIINVFPNSGIPSGGLDWVNGIVYNDWLRLLTPPDPNFFGINLAAKPQDFQTAGLVLLTVPILTGVLTFMQSKMMMPSKPLKTYPSDSPKEVKEKESFEETMSSIQGPMMYMMPFMVAYFAFIYPSGLAIYWNMLTILGIVQQYIVSGWGGMSEIYARLGIKVPEKITKPETIVKVERTVKKGTKKHGR
jgi:YidC/Oxa1 family membrane protein insertase